ncbi:helix-turn-helix transcriptional regulator [Kribbella sp. NBC_01245]|uniref:helix-turn-helix transcriptional regulator n=1 Tax=Kribbella sp. NBC_01245 TaxID=2903578 RepID=UPI002E2BDA70|nr:LuxR C-terminal-related transcriptional regulator [Kribbella sp. NBC_01245]
MTAGGSTAAVIASTTSWPFVSRHAAVDQLETALANPSYRGLVIAGEAGVGKSRLAAECATRAEGLGFTVAVVKAIPLAGLGPLLPGGRQLLLIDDAHLLDDASAAVVHQIVVRRQAVVILTMRSGPGVPMPASVLSLWKDRLLDRLDLEPFGSECVNELLDAVLAGPIDGACRRDLWETSRGNLLYLRELVQAALDTGDLHRDDGLWRLKRLPISQRLCELVESELVDLDRAEHRALDLLAVGEPIEARLIDRDVLHSLEHRGLTTAVGTDLIRLKQPVHGHVRRRRMTLATRLALAEVEVAPEVPEQDKSVLHGLAQAMAHLQAGAVAEAEPIVAAGYQSALDQRYPSHQAWWALLRGNLAVLTGQLTTATTLYAEGAAVAKDLGMAGLRRWCLTGRAIAAAQQGEASAALDGEPGAFHEAELLRAQAWQAVAVGNLELARHQLHLAVKNAEAAKAYAQEAAAWHDLVRISATATDEAAAALAQLSDHVDGELMVARVLQARGMAIGDLGLLVNAADRFAAMNLPLFAAEAYAMAAGKARLQEHRRRAEGLAARAQDLAARCQQARTPALELAGPAATLTTRERDVTALAARGLSSKQIAEHFTLSVRTVDSHLLRAYAKLGVRGRNELATALAW